MNSAAPSFSSVKNFNLPGFTELVLYAVYNIFVLIFCSLALHYKRSSILYELAKQYYQEMLRWIRYCSIARFPVLAEGEKRWVGKWCLICRCIVLIYIEKFFKETDGCMIGGLQPLWSLVVFVGDFIECRKGQQLFLARVKFFYEGRLYSEPLNLNSHIIAPAACVLQLSCSN